MRSSLTGFSSSDDGDDGPVLLVISGSFRSATAAEMNLLEDCKHTEVLVCIAADALRPTER